MNSTPIFIARHLSIKGRDTNRRTSTGITVAVAGIALAIVVMMLSIAVMNGFRDEIRRKVTGFEAQITISIPPPPSDISLDGSSSLTPSPVTLSQPVIESIKAVTDGRATFSLASLRPTILKTSDSFVGVVARGSDRPEGISLISDNITDGEMPDFNDPESKNSLVVSRAVASNLGISTGDKVQAYFFGDGAVKARNLTVSAIYDTHFSDYDQSQVFTSLSLLQGVDKMSDNQGTRIEITGLSDDAVDNTATELQKALVDNLYAGRDSVIYQIDNVHHKGALYFNWLDLLDTNVTVILIIMTVVAAITLISCLFIMILERVNMIGILKALGASNSFIRRIFILVAQKIVIKGVVIGNAIGLALIFLQSHFHFIPLDADTYYLSYVPVEITGANLLWLNLGAIVISTLILILPSHAVANVSPARSIRFE